MGAVDYGERCHRADWRSAGALVHRHQLQRLLGSRLPGPVRGVRANRSHHAGVHQSASSTTLFRGGRSRRRRSPKAATDHDDDAGGNSRIAASGSLPRDWLRFPAPVRNRYCRRSDRSPHHEHISAAHALCVGRARNRRAARGRRRVRGRRARGLEQTPEPYSNTFVIPGPGIQLLDLRNGRLFEMNSLVYGILGGVLLLCVFAGSLAPQNSAGTNPQRAQDSRSDPPPATTPATNPPASTTPDPQFTPDLPELPKRMFGMIPDFENTNDIPANHRPMTVSQKFVLALHQAFDISAHLGNAFQAALQQAADSQPHYGEGWTAYGKRFAAAEGDQISGSLLIYGALPSILHEDPRYFRKGRGSTIARMWYAANRTFVTPRDNGSSGFNNSEAFGQLISCAISP